MRTLVILRGAPGAGKSTWIKNHNLEPYTLSPDNLRILCSTYDFKADGTFATAGNMQTEQQTWKILFELLEFRMARGEFTVIDATASKTRDINQYKELADQYRYRMYCVDFSTVPLEVCLQQNKMRPSEKWVPEKSIENIYARFATQKVPTGVQIIKPADFDLVVEKPFDLSGYKKVVFVGDIHGCYSTLMQYFDTNFSDDVAYIFLGDYIDRGNENVETVKFLSSIMDKKNVCLLEGNHERWLRSYGNSAPSKSKEFEDKTRRQFEAGGFTDRDSRMLYRKLRQFSHFTYNGLEVLACHGGIPHMNKNLLYIPADAFIKGVGGYNEYCDIAETWMNQTAENQFLVHGHRNTGGHPTQIADRVFNLEGSVEFGGELRIVELDSDLNWAVLEIPDCQPVTEDLITETRAVDTVEQAIEYLENNPFVQAKALGDDIVSYNFTRQAFFKGNWNKQTILARGLFLDTECKAIMARSYEKFFKINEVHETELAALRDRLVFPVKAWVKENGFLGIVSYNYKKDDLFVASKSTNQGDYVGYFRKLLAPYYKEALEYVRDMHNAGTPVSLVFEVIDVEKDPHIIKYTDSHIVLLDVIENVLNYKCKDEDTLLAVAERIGCQVKEKAFVLKDWEAFKDLYTRAQDEEFQYNDTFVEGFVFEDAAGFMTKCKTGFYNLWKKLRGVVDQTLRCGHISRTGMLTSSIENYFYGYCRELFNTDRDPETKTYPYKTDIINLRDKFMTR